MRDIVIKKKTARENRVHTSFNIAYVARKDDSVTALRERHRDRSMHVDFCLSQKVRIVASRPRSSIIPYDFIDFGPRNLLPSSIMVDFTLCHRLQIQLRLNAPNKYVMTAIDLPSRSEDSKIKSRFVERNIQKGQKRLFTIFVLY